MPPDVAMVSANAVVNDARVVKYATTVAGLGYDVVAVGLSPDGARAETTAGGVPVVQAALPRSAAPAAIWRRLTARVGRELRTRRRGTPGTLRGSGRRIDLYRRRPWLAPGRLVLRDVRRQERAVLAELRRLRPGVVHVHDVYLLGAAVRYAREAGDHVRVVYDAHEYVLGLANVVPRRVAALRLLEERHIGAADRVVTVSEPLADLLLRDHHLAERPLVVLNAPVEAPAGAEVRPVRDVVGLPPDVPLLVYAGGLVVERGVQTVVDALPELPGVHLAVIVNRPGSMTRWLRARAAALGVADRLHFAPFVPPEQVAGYVASATLGLSPLLRAPNHDVAVTNKFCEYLAAGLPIVTSDTPAQATLVRELGLGTVHVAGDATDCARAVRAALAGRDRLAARIGGDAELRHRFSWAAQVDVIRRLYETLAGPRPDRDILADRHDRAQGDSTR
ncbi:glycosyltransferase family 4 protein [Jiangella anatolica]|uniref:Glycosyl transferase family 1 n=1 Tax=Jiangella anatolica TaxID=2670374 RepID=A0A2W2CKM0_9ACTN|nr:glycosyltransferase family 4 protein [Jiangella anatolica]PZF80733.1 glycosyl transferase family 1 [Jiangella anatolica]